MIDKVVVANSALLMVGADTIPSFDANAPQAFQVKQYWDLAIEVLLAEFDWSWATKTANLALIDDPYQYVHKLPTDFLRLVQLDSGAQFELRLWNQQLALYSSNRDESIRYITKSPNFTNVSAQAMEAFVLRLAVYLDICRNAGANVDRLTKLYESALHTAIRFEPTNKSRVDLDMGHYNTVRQEEG